MLRSSVLTAVPSLLAAGSALADNMEQCSKDTWGMAGDRYSKPFVPVGRKELTCTFNEVDISKIPLFVVNWYNTSEDFDLSWKGIDMNPKRHSEYRGSPWVPFRLGTLQPWNKVTNGPPFQKSDITLSSCEIPRGDGSFFRIQRVGPLVSTGGYDYWQFGWRDVWGLSEVLKQHPNGVMITTSFSAGVLADGTALGFPPIHIHHIHIGPYFTTPLGLLGNAVKAKESSSAILGLEQHGDYECTEVDGGTDCLFEHVGDGFAKVLDSPWSLEGEINDVRAFFSEPMTWWYQIVVHYQPRTQTLRPLSQTFVIGPGPMGTNQLATLLVFPTPTAEKTFYWYSGRMWHNGVLVRNKIHSHNSQFHMALWFRATPAELGLHEERFKLGSPQLPLLCLGAPTCIPRPLRESGFATFDDLRAHLLRNLAGAADAHDARCSFLAKSRCRNQRPALICQANNSFQEKRDPRSGKVFRYDRRGPTCCRPWTFYTGDMYTVVGFMNEAERPPGPWNPNTIPETLPMHLHWVTQWDAMDNTSHYAHNTGYLGFLDIQTDRPHRRYNPNERVKFIDRGGGNKPVVYMVEPPLQEGEGDVANFMTVSQDVVLGVHRGRGSTKMEAVARLGGASISMAMLWFACGRRWRRDCPAVVHCVRMWAPRFPFLRVKYVQHAS